MMTLAKARETIRRDAPWVRHCEAAAVLASSPDSSIDDLVACLQHPGLPAETAATALYVRTGRKREPFVMDAGDWMAFLKSAGMA